MPPPPTEQNRWFSEEVLPHGPHLRAYVRGTFPGVRDVEDVVQESYLRLWRASAAASVSSARGLLFHIARGVARNFLRKDRNAPFVPGHEQAVCDVVDERVPDSRDALLIRERIELMTDALMSLPPRAREIMILHKLQGCSQREVAGRLGISERTVEAQVRIGISRCTAFARSDKADRLREP